MSLTLLEVGSLGGLVAAAWLLPAEKVNVKGSWTLKELAAFLCTKATIRLGIFVNSMLSPYPFWLEVAFICLALGG